MSDVTILHNPGCSTSRKVLGMIRERGIEPRIVEYLKTPPSRAEFEGMLSRMGQPARAVLRKKNTNWEALGLGDPGLPEARVIEAMLANPMLIERPIVATPRGVRLCRPPESVLDLLPKP